MENRHQICRALVAVIAALACASFGGTKVWTGLGANAKASTADNWEAEAGQDPAAPVAGDAVVFDATGRDHPCTWDLDIPLASWTQDGYTNVVTIQTVYSSSGFDCLEITGDVVLNSGIWTHTANSSAETYRLRVDVGGDMTIGPNAAIDLSKKGYAVAKGPGYAGSTTGGAHGGQSTGSHGSESRCYGSIASPVNIGSGGSKYESQGGGALRLTVAGVLTHNGSIRADGRTYLANGTLATYYGAAGGSVWITAGSLTGAGSISASSGTQNNNYYGGGGRVSLVITDAGADFSAFTGEVKATSTYNGGYKANSGTVYYETAADGAGHGVVVVDGYNTSVDANYTDIILDDQDANFEPRRLEIGRKARVRITAGTRKALCLPEGIIITNTGTLLVGAGTMITNCPIIKGLGSGTASLTLASGASLASKQSLVFNKISMTFNEGTSMTCSAFLPTNSVTVTVNGAADWDTPVVIFPTGCTLVDNAPLSINGSVILRSGAMVTHSANGVATDLRIQMDVSGSLTVESGASIDTTDKGYPKAEGLGAALANSRGANHGGRGLGSSGTPNGKVCYGSITRPTAFGSAVYTQPASGAIKIVCDGPITNNGVISSCGRCPNVQYTSSGGSVWLVAASLAGNGYIQANAYGDSTKIPRGNTSATSNRSGGGRVAVWLTDSGADFSDFGGVISAWGCGNKTYLGGAGTVYLKTGDQADNEGTLIIDNRYNATTVGDTEIGEYVTDAEVGSVILGLGARLRVIDEQTFTVRGSFSITNSASTFTMEDGSTLVFAGTAPATVSGALSAAKVICQTPGKTIHFAAGSSLSVSELLTMEGSAESPIVLDVAGGAGSWNLTLGPDAAQSVSHVAVSGSDASAGLEVVAINSTGSGTVNWRFENVAAGETITWTGTESTTWAAAGNWDLGRAPISADLVVIPTGCQNQPELVAETSCAGLSVASGATLSLMGYDLSVTGDATIQGGLVASGSETLTFGGDVDFMGSSFTEALSTVILNGSGGQDFNAGSTSFNVLDFSNTSADGIAFSGTPFARNFSCAPPVESAVTFANGASLSVSVSLTLKGAAAATPLHLVPATAGGSWQIISTAPASVEYVAVSNSTAAANMIAARSSQNLGGNTGWIFDGSHSTTWTGAVDGDFTVAGNWTAGVPDEDDEAVIGAGATVSLASEAAIRSLVLDGGTLSVQGSLAVAEAASLAEGATAILNGTMAVGGSVIMASGSTMTHTTVTTSMQTGIDLVVGGELVVEEGAAITAKGTSTSNRGRSIQDRGGGAHGGRSWRSGSTAYNPCYGSVYFPTNAGTRSEFDNKDLRGGGVLRLRVAGRLVLDGTADADGQDGNIDYYSGSGGSVWITAGEIVGNGAISANGGGGGSCGGAGGRIAIYLTDEGSALGNSPSVTVVGGHSYSDGYKIPNGAPGTFYVETAADAPGCGTVRVANHPSASASTQYVDYPSTLNAADGDGRDAVWRLSGYSFLYITRDAKIADVWLEGSKPRIYLNGHTLRIRTTRHALGTNESAQVIPGGTAENPGKIIWFNPTILLLK